MHLGCAIGQMAQKNYHGRTFRKTVRPSWRNVFPSGAVFENGCARLFTCSLYFLKILFPFYLVNYFFCLKCTVQVGQRQGKSGNFTINFQIRENQRISPFLEKIRDTSGDFIMNKGKKSRIYDFLFDFPVTEL